MARTLVKDTVGQIGQIVTLKGWVHSRRDHGGLIFIDIRDHTGVAQLVVQPENADTFATAEHVRDEYVIEAQGLVRERVADLKNPNIATGDIELKVDELKVLNSSEALPIQIHGETLANEDLRLKYRFL